VKTHMKDTKLANTSLLQFNENHFLELVSKTLDNATVETLITQLLEENLVHIPINQHETIWKVNAYSVT